MAIFPITYLHQAQVESGIERAVKALAPTVVRIRYSFEDDWTGNPSVFFRILVTDEAAKVSRLAEMVNRIEEGIRDEISLEELGIPFYFNFRSESEQADMKSPSWA